MITMPAIELVEGYHVFPHPEEQNCIAIFPGDLIQVEGIYYLDDQVITVDQEEGEWFTDMDRAFDRGEALCRRLPGRQYLLVPQIWFPEEV